MPQPLSSYLSIPGDWGLEFGDSAIENEPKLAILFARVIVRHSLIEHHLGYLLIKILRAHAKPGYAMFNALASTKAKADALRAAAQSILPKAEMRALNTVWKIAGRMTGQRNKLAHNLWGYCPQVPHALIKREHSEAHQMAIRFADHWRALSTDPAYIGPENPGDVVNPDLNSILVYRENDFKKMLADFEETLRMLMTLALIIAPMESLHGVPHVGPSRAELFRQLCALPLFREERSRERASRRKNQKAQL